VIGGNLKEGDSIELTATAIGLCSSGKCMSRYGCKEDELIVAIGEIGVYWALVLLELNGLLNKLSYNYLIEEKVFLPKPKLQVGVEIAEKELLTSCIDNSDGLYPCLIQLATTNHKKMVLELENINYNEIVYSAGNILHIEHKRFAFGWGGWELIGCTKPDSYSELANVCRKHNVPLHLIGHVEDGVGVYIKQESQIKELAPIDSQRLTLDSWLNKDLQSYVDILINTPL
jgi:thiamine-monophosphate kinase